jgi:hypothetical protein
VFYERGVEAPLQKLLNLHPDIKTLAFPIGETELKDMLLSAKV